MVQEYYGSLPVWVANRDNPLLDSSGALKITETGNIAIVGNQTENFIWSSNSSAKYPTLQLLDTGIVITHFFIQITISVI